MFTGSRNQQRMTDDAPYDRLIAQSDRTAHCEAIWLVLGNGYRRDAER